MSSWELVTSFLNLEGQCSTFIPSPPPGFSFAIKIGKKIALEERMEISVADRRSI